jgi:DNA adenine methylase
MPTTYTPLRYPGAKRRLIPFIGRLLQNNGLSDIEYAEPFAGGASIAIAVLLDEFASLIHINDLSRPVYAFWHSVLNRTDDLCELIHDAKIDIPEWQHQREVYRARKTADLLDLGFAAFFLNRTNRSGIISGGVIGGQKQTGAWTVGARFNRHELIQRIRRISRYKSRIRLHQMDALEFTKKIVPTMGENAFLFYDPPYIEVRNRYMYLNEYDIKGHRLLEEQIKILRKPWVVVYDDIALQYRLYQTYRRIVYGLHYTVQDKYEGQEVAFFSDDLSVPSLDVLLGTRMRPNAAMSRLSR